MSCLNKSNRKKTLQKILPVISLTCILLLAVFVSNKAAKAAKLGDGAWSQSGSPGVTTVTFTNTTAADGSSDIVLTFPSTANVDQDGTTASVTGTTNYIRTNNTVDNTVTISILDGTLAASAAITITLADGLTTYTTTTYAQESMAINTQDSGDTPLDFGVALITNDNTTTVTASVPLFVNMAVDDTSVELGTLSTASVSTATQTYTVNSNNQTGVTLQIAADGDLDDISANTIDEVAGGTVDAGTEEYGIAVTGSSLTIDATYISGDNPIVQAPDPIANSAGSVSNATMDITYKASIAGTTVAGSYNQVVTITIATNA
jgi:hypothetical protein